MKMTTTRSLCSLLLLLWNLIFDISYGLGNRKVVANNEAALTIIKSVDWYYC